MSLVVADAGERERYEAERRAMLDEIARTTRETLETRRGWMEELGKAPVVVRSDVPGFVVNRLQYALLREAYALVAAGVCSFEDVDRAVTAGLGARWADTLVLAALVLLAATRPRGLLAP